MLRTEAIRLDSREEQHHDRYPPAISPLRQRMIDNKRMHKLADKTHA